MTEPNLRFPAGLCENLRFSAKIRGFLRFPAPSTCLNFQEKGWICENLRFSAKIWVLGSLCHLSSVPLSVPWFAAMWDSGEICCNGWLRSWYGSVVSQKHCNTNEVCIQMHMEGALRHTWQAWVNIVLSSRPKSRECTATDSGGLAPEPLPTSSSD